MHTHFLLRTGMKNYMGKVLLPNRDGMAAVFLHII